MDLIYADENKKEIGIIDPYSFDIAFGKNENDFQCIVDITDNCCKKGYIIFAENSEIGGIVDSIEVNTEKEQIIYSGRSWHGILENKIISPDAGKDYLFLSGDANEVVSFLLERAELTDLFEKPSGLSEIIINNYQCPRFEPCYTLIIDMLKKYKAKLNIVWKENKINISVAPAADYTDEINNFSNNIKVSKNYSPCNHLISLGKGDLAERKVIHLFTDNSGNIQPYAKKANPLINADYILDESKKLISGSDEIVKVYELSNAETTNNYILLNSKPSDWNSNYKYYYTKVDDEYKSVSGDSAPAFTYNMYYEKVTDDYAVLVSKGIEKLNEYWQTEKCSLSLSENDCTFDVNDIVGAEEFITNTKIKAFITKKIIKIKNNETTIDYEVS